jgi:hypothetical protein
VDVPSASHWLFSTDRHRHAITKYRRTYSQMMRKSMGNRQKTYKEVQTLETHIELGGINKLHAD